MSPPPPCNLLVVKSDRKSHTCQASSSFKSYDKLSFYLVLGVFSAEVSNQALSYFVCSSNSLGYTEAKKRNVVKKQIKRFPP